ncbi:insulinase family protein, partial [Larkinella sp. C7]
MYLDDPDYQLYSGILANLYPNTKLTQDIAGSQESLKKITLKWLRNSHKAYYRPDNLSLFLVGNFDYQTALATIKENQRNFTTKLTKIDKKTLKLTEPVKRKSIRFDVAKPK